MKTIITIFILLVGHLTAIAQTPIVDSKIKYKNFKDVKWITKGKIEKERKTVVEFYLDGNPSCRIIMDEVLLPMHENNPDLQIIILAINDSKRLHKIAKNYPSIHVGIDELGTVFRHFAVKYVPASVLIGENDKILWRGALNQKLPQF